MVASPYINIIDVKTVHKVIPDFTNGKTSFTISKDKLSKYILRLILAPNHCRN